MSSIGQYGIGPWLGDISSYQSKGVGMVPHCQGSHIHVLDKTFFHAFSMTIFKIFHDILSSILHSQRFAENVRKCTSYIDAKFLCGDVEIP